MVYNIQLLRVIAAFSVVYVHITAVLGLPFSVGVFGVDLFFVISGFIMPYLAEKEPSQFFRRRLIRILPAYWTLTFAMYAAVSLRPAYFHTTQASPELLFRSLFFLPYDPATGPVPIVAIGWTLIYEMYFYAIFALALMLNARNASVIAASALIGLLLLFRLAGTPELKFYADPIVLEFILGLLCFQLWKRLPRGQNRPPRRAFAWGVSAILAIALVILPVAEILDPARNLPRWIAFGLPAFVAVASALVLERSLGAICARRPILALSDASYILFLTHFFVVAAVARFVPASAGLWTKAVLVLPLMAVCAIVAALLYSYAEKPAIDWLKRRLLAPGTASIPGASAP